MRKALLVVTALGAAACGGTIPHQVKGATFQLSSKEVGIADEYERGAPRAGDIQTRCDYWTQRREDANGNHLVGIFSWPPEYFQNLRDWAEAKKAEVCDVAKAAADARTASANEEARIDALEDAKQEHDAREERAWSQARAEDCAAATKEDACNGVKAYLAMAPAGRHAGEANAALQAGTPKLTELHRRHDEGVARRAAEISKLEQSAGFRVTGVRVSLEDAPAGGGDPGQYLRIVFDITALRLLARTTTPLVRVACQVTDKRMVAVEPAVDARLDELAAGDTKELDASPYLKRALHATPSRCDIEVLKGTGPEPSGPIVDSFCYVPGRDVDDGACAR